MAQRKPRHDNASLPFAALQLLAPPVRLVSAALWKVLKQRDVMQYGVVEEFVTSACETVPGLLTLRHQGKLALGLRARLILELCLKSPDVNVIAPHLKRIRAPSSASDVKKDVKVQKTVECFHAFVQTLLTNPAEKEHFFKEQFPIDYGPKFDQELEKLLWEFLIRLDQLLPVPNLAQTVSWLSTAPPVLEECARAATQPQLLKILLQHQTCLGHLEAAASLPPNMGDSILASLSLPPSGKLPSNQPTGAGLSAAERTDASKPAETAPFITPVIGLISNDSVPAMVSARKRAAHGHDQSKSKDAAGDRQDPSREFTLVKQRPEPVGGDPGQKRVGEGRSSFNPSGGGKRKRPDAAETDSEEEEMSEGAPGEKRVAGDQRPGETAEDGSETVENNDRSRELLNVYARKPGVEKLRLPEDPALRAAFASCLSSDPRVVIQKLPFCPASTSWSGGGGGSFYKEQQKKTSSAWKPTRGCQTAASPGLDDKENQPVPSGGSGSPSQQRSHAGDDYVADSEDEASKNFKGRLFMKRYYKTKHGTYVPTLREFWKPGVTRRDLLSAARKRR
ncbi:TERF1-interacting nuclear factor 2 [Fundulus heteroclitus]|uniref:TERF1-interacting nuclear factor 2 n=1 Tax=Fundulus heteroclitus TaxID=8078 RepID=UPI00165B0268|nr:TERF1-interacting nuclear factor 2 [Fundulus heteroclitus]